VSLQFKIVARGNTTLPFKLPPGFAATPTGSRMTIVVQ